MELPGSRAMKVRTMIKLVEHDGWFLIEHVAATANIDTIRKRALSPLLENRATILRPVHKTIF